MVLLSAFWLPVLLSAIIIFIASSITHTMLAYHRETTNGFPMRTSSQQKDAT